MLNLDGKTAIVTGCGSEGEGWGNGRAIATLLARQGAKVIGTDLNYKAAKNTQDFILKENNKCEIHEVNMSNKKDVESFFKNVTKQHEKINILVNNVGRSEPGDPEVMDYDVWREQFSTNLDTAFFAIKQPLFSALKVERNVMFIILSLIIIVAAFNIISGLTILVKNKTKDIAILKSIGVLNKSIIKIFFLVGVIIGTSATIFGIILGVTFSIYVENLRQFLSTLFNISLFPEEIYFLSTMPSEINPPSILLISLCSIIITIIVSIFPALKAAKLDPVKALKYE